MFEYKSQPTTQKKNEICDQNVTEVKNWHALYNKRNSSFWVIRVKGSEQVNRRVEKEKETLRSHKSAAAGITGFTSQLMTHCITGRLYNWFNNYTTQVSP